MKQSQKILKLIQRDGAMTTTQIAKELDIDRDKVGRLLAKLVLENEVVWVGGIPPQGVFFKLKGAKGFGIPLRNKALGRSGKAGGRKPKYDDLILEVLEASEHAMTAVQLSEFLNIHINTMRHAVTRLSGKGLIFGRTLPGVYRGGRPPTWWSADPWEDLGREAEEPAVTPSSEPDRKRKTKKARHTDKIMGRILEDGEDEEVEEIG